MTPQPTTVIRNKDLEAYATRLERKCMREHGASLSAGSISRHANPFVTEIRDELVFLSGDWRGAMRAAIDEWAGKWATRDEL